MKLSEKITTKKVEHASSRVLSLIKKCHKYQISYDLMCRLNYYDLLAIVVELDIDSIKDNLAMLQNEKNQKVDIVNATNEDILSMHGGRKRGGKVGKC